MAAPLPAATLARIQLTAARRLAERAEQAIKDAAEAKAAVEELAPPDPLP